MYLDTSETGLNFSESEVYQNSEFGVRIMPQSSQSCKGIYRTGF